MSTYGINRPNAEIGIVLRPAHCGSMIYNITDSRKRPYRWRRINAVIEATSNDWNVDDSDEQPSSPDDIVFKDRKNISLQEAVAWASAEPSAVTLFLYDEGDGI